MSNVIPAVPAPTGSSAADLLDWWDARAALTTTRTNVGHRDLCRRGLIHLAGEQPLAEFDIRTLDVASAVSRLETELWAHVSDSSRDTYTGQFRTGIKQFLNAVIDPDRNRPRRTEVRKALGAGPGITVTLPSGGTAQLTIPERVSTEDAAFLHNILAYYLNACAQPDGP